MDINAIQQAISQNRQDLGQRYAEIPKLMNQAGSIANDSQIQNLQQNKNQKILELYNHDKALADRYANPQSDTYMSDPYAREKARAIQNQATAGEVLDINSQIQQRRDTIGDALDKGMKVMQAGIQMKTIENQLLQNEFDNAVKLQQLDEQRKERESGSSDLTALWNAIMQVNGVQSKAQAAKPLAQGVSKDLNQAKQLAKQLGGIVRFNKRPDGAYEWSITNDQTQFLTPEEANLAENPKKYIQQLAGATIASNPKMASEVQALLAQLMPQEDVFPTNNETIAAGVAGMPINPQTMQIAQNYSKNKDLQLVTEPGWFKLGPITLGRQQYLVDKQTGVRSPVGGQTTTPQVNIPGIGNPYQFNTNSYASGFGGPTLNRPPLSSFDK